MRIDRIKLITLMAKKDMKIKDLAQLSGMSRNAISAVRSGAACRDSTAQAIADALNVPLEKLTKGAGE